MPVAQKSNTFEITLQLQNVVHLFEEPDITPFSSYYRTYSFKAGMDYIVGELFAHPSAQRIKLNLILPPDQINPELLEKTYRAIEKYSVAWMHGAEQDMAKTRYRGIRAAIAGVFGMLVLFSAALWLEGQDGFIEHVLANGLFVAGWVLLWRPIDTLIFDVWDFSLERKAYQALRNIELEILPEEPTMIDKSEQKSPVSG